MPLLHHLFQLQEQFHCSVNLFYSVINVTLAVMVEKRKGVCIVKQKE
uniref:Uncharacterized protein n=1 Tax=Anguilla anguilla TaxID=7936 RepID=A0A0E9Y188_ANGAN